MSRDALESLVAAAARLPTPEVAEAAPTPPRGPDRRRLRDVAAPADAIGPVMLRTRVRELLAELARRLDASLPQTLAQADGAWDQVDALRILDRAVHDEVRALQRAARVLAADEDPVNRALGLEARLTLDAAVDLCALVERRLATLVRLRLRAADPTDTTLLPDGKPFLDLGAALHETARRWV